MRIFPLDDLLDFCNIITFTIFQILAKCLFYVVQIHNSMCEAKIPKLLLEFEPDTSFTGNFLFLRYIELLSIIIKYILRTKKHQIYNVNETQLENKEFFQSTR